MSDAELSLIQLIYSHAAYGSGSAVDDVQDIAEAIEGQFGKSTCEAWSDTRKEEPLSDQHAGALAAVERAVEAVSTNHKDGGDD